MGPNAKMCDICGVTFSRSDSVARHRKTHTGEKPHKCVTCGRAFARHDYLKSHEGTCASKETSQNINGEPVMKHF